MVYNLPRIATEFSSPEALKNYLHEHPHADKSKHHVKDDHGGGGEHKDAPKKSLKERLQSMSDKAKSFVKSAPKEVSSFLQDDAHRRKTLTAAHSELTKAPEKLVKNVVTTVKHEIHEFKEAGAGIKAVLSGKKMNDHQKKALKTVAFHVGLTVAATALTVSGGPLAGLAAFGKSMAKHVAMKAASNALGHLHILEELGHVGHGIHHLLDKLAAEESDVDEMLVQYVMALMAKELENLDADAYPEIIEEASKGESDKKTAMTVASRFAGKDLVASRVALRFRGHPSGA